MALQVHIHPPLGAQTCVREPVISFRVYFVYDSRILVDGAIPRAGCVEIWSNMYNSGWQAVPFTEYKVTNVSRDNESVDAETVPELLFLDRSQVGDNHHIQQFSLDMPILPSMARRFEFTVRWQYESMSADQGIWHWAGGIGQNAQVSLIRDCAPDPDRTPLNYWRQKLRSAFEPLSAEGGTLKQQHLQAIVDSWRMSSTSASCLFKVDPAKVKQCVDPSLTIGRLANVERYLAFVRKDPFWIIPHYGGHNLDTNDMDVVFILAELSTGAYVSIMPFTQNPSVDCMPMLRSSDIGALSVHASQAVPLRVIRIAMTINTRPYGAVRELFDRIQQSLLPRRPVDIPKTTQSAATLHTVALDTHLGYCTWNAFYQQVSHSKIISAVRDICHIGISSGQPQPAWVAIDDGWQSVSRYDGFGQLYDMHASREKFPGQLSQTVTELGALGISRVGVWHALWGYWGGVDPDGPLARRYPVERYHRKWSPVADECDVWLIGSAAIAQFYDEFYGWLQSEGVSFVKADYQAAFESLEGYGEKTSISTMYSAYVDAMESAALKHFGPGSIIYCMAQSPQLIARALQSSQQEQPEYPPLQHSLFRNSDDYFPDVPTSHGWHIQCNLANSVWSRCLGRHLVADWDMFKPGKLESDTHAASRILSGGPVYITGVPSDYQDQELSRYVGISGVFAERYTQFLDHNLLFSDMTNVPGLLTASAAAPNAEAVLVTVYNTTGNDLVSSIPLVRLYGNIMLETDDTSGSAGSSVFVIFQNSTKRAVTTSLIPTAITIALKSFGCDMFSITRMSALKSSDRSAVLYAACLGDTGSYAGSTVVDRSVYSVLPRPSSIGSSSSLGSTYTPPASPCVYAMRSWNIRARITCQPSTVSFVFRACGTLSDSQMLPLTISSVRISGYEIPSDRWSFSESTGVLTIKTDWSAESLTASTQPSANPTTQSAYITVNVTA